MISGNEDDARAMPDLAQKFLQDVVMRLRPMRSAPDFPEIDDIADEVDRVGFDDAQEVEQGLGLRRARPQMHVGDEQRAKVLIAASLRIKCCASVFHEVAFATTLIADV